MIHEVYIHIALLEVDGRQNGHGQVGEENNGERWANKSPRVYKLIYHYDPVLADPKAVTRNTHNQQVCVHTHTQVTVKETKRTKKKGRIYKGGREEAAVKR